MHIRYPIKVALTSLALVAALPGATPGHARPPACADLRRLYSARLLHRARAELLLALEREHAKRAVLAAAVVRGTAPASRLPQRSYIVISPQESTDRKLKHLLALLATSCR